MSLRVYVLGKMRGIPCFNFPAFDAMAKRLRESGFEPISPADIDRREGLHPESLPLDFDWSQMPPGLTLSTVIERDLKVLQTCEAYVALPGWQHSTGGRAEKAVLDWKGAQRLDADTFQAWKEPGIMTSQIQMQIPPQTLARMRAFASGATRDTAANKPEYDGFLSYPVLEAYGLYMMKHQVQSDGNLRAADNWQKGIPKPVYMSSLFRHFLQAWALHRGYAVKDDKGQPVTLQDALCGVMFNVMGYFHELLRPKPDS